MGNEPAKTLAKDAVAGVAGAVVYTKFSALLKARLRPHESVQPLQAAKALTKSGTKSGSKILNSALHWGYGAWGGLLRGVLVRSGLTGWRAEVAHLVTFWLPWRLILLGGGKRATGRELAVDLVKHATYVAVVGVAHRGLTKR